MSVLSISACEQNTDTEASTSNLVSKNALNALQPAAVVEKQTKENTQFNLDNKQYLFDVADHTPEEMHALFSRADEIRETQAEGYDDLEIVLILHGPDINIFRQENYSKHKSLVDLAAKLDAFDIIDMKICDRSMSSLGIERSEVPAFIESVSFAPEEIRRLREGGYVNL